MGVIVKTRAGKRVGLLYCTSDFLSKAYKAMSAERPSCFHTNTRTKAMSELSHCAETFKTDGFAIIISLPSPSVLCMCV